MNVAVDARCEGRIQNVRVTIDGTSVGVIQPAGEGTSRVVPSNARHTISATSEPAPGPSGVSGWSWPPQGVPVGASDVTITLACSDELGPFLVIDPGR